MPEYVIKIDTDVVLDRKGLDRLEDVVYDVLVDEQGGSTDIILELVDDKFVNAGGATDVAAAFV